MKDMVFDDFRNWMCDRFINSQSRRAAKLSPTYLLTHESGIVGDVINQIDRTVWSKSSFDLCSDRIKGAELLFYVNDYKNANTSDENNYQWKCDRSSSGPKPDADRGVGSEAY